MFAWLGRHKPPPPSTIYDPRATSDDVSACFRLLLGRAPNKEEWRGHAMQAGQDLAVVVAGYLNSLEFANRGLLRQKPSDDVLLAELPEFVIYTDVDDAAVGRFVRDNNYELEVTAVFRRFVRRGMGVLDLGANIGYFTLLSAVLVGSSGHVLAIEPNQRNVRLLEASRLANRFEHVQIVQVAAGEETGLLALHTSHSNGTTSTLPSDLDALLSARIVARVPADALVKPEQQVDFIKVDVEGAEYRALLGCQKTIARCRPMIVSEFSPDLMPGVSGIEGIKYLEWLLGQRYSISIIEADGSTTATAQPAEVMAAYAHRGTDHIDILAVPL